MLHRRRGMRKQPVMLRGLARVRDPQEWSDDKKSVMEEIVTVKAHQIAETRAILEKFDDSITFAEGPSIGLDNKVSAYTKHKNSITTIELDSFTKSWLTNLDTQKFFHTPKRRVGKGSSEY